MIRAFNFCGTRDKELGELMATTLRKYCSYNLASLTQKNMDGQGYGNGAGWEPSMLKLDTLREIVNMGVSDNDWVLSIDSDVVFTSRQVFDWMDVVTSFKHNNFSIVGIQQAEPLADSHIGKLHNMSGCAIFLRGGVAKKIAQITPEQLESVHEQFKAYVLAEQEDIVISYLAQMVGAIPLSIPGFMTGGDLQKELAYGLPRTCMHHLNFSPEKFLGMNVCGKWDIPGVLRQKGIVL
jgi:hypothetical protein